METEQKQWPFGTAPVNPEGVEDPTNIPANNARRLRIEILAALGVTEV